MIVGEIFLNPYSQLFVQLRLKLNLSLSPSQPMFSGTATQ